MNHNVEELNKIETASKGFFRGANREAISYIIKTFESKMLEVKSKSGVERKETIKKHLELATGLRHSALRKGANSYKDAQWAAAALVESWLFLLRDGTSEEIQIAESIIDRMR